MTSWEMLLADVSSLVIFFVLLPVVLAIFFLVAWREVRLGADSPLTPRIFWLLFIGGFLGWIGNIPIFYFGGSIMAVNMGGALVPSALSLYFLIRVLRPEGWERLTLLFGAYTLAVTVLVLMEILSARFHLLSPVHLLWTMEAVVFFLFGVLLYLLGRMSVLTETRVRATLPLLFILSVVTLLTYFTTYVDPGQGIVSLFPIYLLPPILGGLLSLFVSWQRREDAPFVAYATATLGTMVGADVLHQPELYSSGAILGSIGGAGPLDLVFLSGLLSFSFTLLLVVLLRGKRYPTAQSTQGDGRPSLQAALAAFRAERYDEVPALALAAVREEASEIDAVVGSGAPGGGRWESNPFPNPFKNGDFANLAAITRKGSSSRENAWLALCTAFFLMAELEDLLSRHLASVLQRISAFVIDLLIFFVPGGLLLYGMAYYWQVGSLDAALASIGYESAILALATYPVVIVSIMESRSGASPGKRFIGLHVLGPGMGRPTPIESLGRNLTKLVTTTTLAFSLGIAIPFAIYGTIGGLVSIFVIGGGIIGVIITGGIGVLVMLGNKGRRRIGDLMVGTRVLRQAPEAPPLYYPGPTMQAWTGLSRS